MNGMREEIARLEANVRFIRRQIRALLLLEKANVEYIEMLKKRHNRRDD